MTMNELISRIEGAGEGSREVDAYIWAVERGIELEESSGYLWAPTSRGQKNVVAVIGVTGSTRDFVPAYTASIDSAMSLLPDGCWATFDPHFMDDEGVVRFRGYVFRPDWARWHPGEIYWLNRVGTPLCATPALAICLAALKARATNNGEG